MTPDDANLLGKLPEEWAPDAGGPLLSAAEMRALEEAEIASGRVTGAMLMERAGAAVARLILWGERNQFRAGLGNANWGYRHVIVLCGTGNNGGDGYVVARHLFAAGWKPRVLAFGEPAPPGTDAHAARAAWERLGRVETMPETRGVEFIDGRGGVLVDAVFGTGLRRPLPALAAREAARAVQLTWGGFRVAIDGPSGLCLDSGRVLQDPEADPPATRWRCEADRQRWALPADVTVTFHAPKLGHVLGDGPRLSGRLFVADIGLREPGARRLDDPGPARTVARPWGGTLDKGRAWRGRAAARHKYDHGHALILAGGVGRGGAARLAARAALRVGAGLVTLGCPKAALIENAARLDAVMVRALPPGGAVALEGFGKIGAVCVGPGFGLGDATRRAVLDLVASGRPLVLDADALTAFAEAPEVLFDALRAATGRAPAAASEAPPPRWPAVLTPHMGEFARLFPDLAAALAEPARSGPAPSRADAARQAAARSGAVLLLKGPDTLIAAPDGRVLVHAALYGRAAPWLATAGAGDVLAGLVTGLLARGWGALEAAADAAWLHVEAARRIGPGLIAEDLAEALPAVLRALVERS